MASPVALRQIRECRSSKEITDTAGVLLTWAEAGAVVPGGELGGADAVLVDGALGALPPPPLLWQPIIAAIVNPINASVVSGLDM